MHYDPPLTQLLFSSACLICVSPPTQFAYHDGGLITTAASTKASVITNRLWKFKNIISSINKNKYNAMIANCTKHVNQQRVSLQILI